MRAILELLLLLPLLLLLCAARQAPQPPAAATAVPPTPPKQYYIAAVEIGWDYIHWEDGDAEQRQKIKDIPQKYLKAVYREYTDGTYTVPKPRPPWIGIQGPVILTKAGDKVAVHFKNLASQPYSISPVGITYWKQSEGAGYDDSTAGQEKEDDAVAPGGYYEYLWDISAKDGPTASDPECLTYSYSSQVDTVRDANSGLIGALLVCRSSALTEKGERRNPAFVLLFAVFDESKSWYGEIGERRRERFQKRHALREYHTINGYVNSTLPGLTMCQSRGHVFWHLIGMGTTPAIHSIQFQDHTLQVVNHRKATMEVTPMTFITAEMKPATLGRFLISCQIHAHQHDGMRGFFTVEDCPEPPDVRNAKQSDYEYSDEGDDDLFNTIIYMPRKPQVQVRTLRGQQSVTLEHYIAAEEITWDYASHLTPSDSELHSAYLPAVPHHLNYRYKKVVYVEYTDASFTQRKNPDRTLLGPLLKGKVNDQFHIVFKNLASRPFNIYPIGLTKIEPLQKSTNAAEKDLRSMGVPPNGTFSYRWKVTTDDGPLEGDPPCLTQLYQSTVSPERDLASGLVGTLLICRYDALDVTGRLLGPDKEWSLTFAVFDENRSWYADENLRQSTQDAANATNPEFYNSNVIYSVNGRMFSGRQFVVCQTDVVYWHVVNVGTQSDFLSIYFMGNLFQDNGLYKSVLTLFPMTGMTLSMEMELKGEWEVSAFDGSLKSRGMSIHYTVRSCDGEIPLVDRDEEDEDISDYIDFLGPRSSRPQNFTALVKVCKKLLPNNKTQTVTVHVQNDTDSSINGTDDQYLRCQLKKVRVTSKEGGNATSVSDEGIPDDILTKIDEDGKWKAALNGSEPEVERGGRRRREAEAGNWTDEGSGDANDRENKSETRKEASGNTTGGKIESEEKDAMPEEKNATKDGVEENNEILLDRLPQLSTKILSSESQDIDHNFVPQNHIKADPEPQTLDLLDVDFNYTAADYNATQIEFSADYDDYNQEVNLTARSTFTTGFLDPRSGNRYHHYYIAAEEITWDYGIRKPVRLIKPRESRRGMRKFLKEYKKVVFRAYKDKNFEQPVSRGEVEEHLGLMGPIIRAGVGDVLTVTFKNKASRPYSFHLQGVYDHSRGAGAAQVPNVLAPSGIPGEPVDPGQARTYNWKVTRTQGPTDKEFDCKTWAYYSTVDKERDLNSGLIGPLVICKPGILWTGQHTHQSVQEFALLFHTFDETKSWYLEENMKQYCTPPCYANPEDPWYHISNKFAAINGYVAETLPGLLVPQHQLVRWHLLNVGSDGEYHAVHFHGLPFTVHTEAEHRMGVYNLFPGVFGTVEMRPPTVGMWLVECTVGDHQLAGMRAKLLIYNPECIFPLGMQSGRIQNSQITASDHIGSWEPRLGRLHQSGYINAWMGKNTQSWLQVDLLKPMLLHGVQTQGVRSRLRDKYISLFTVSYSLDQETWVAYRENNTIDTKMFSGNLESSRVKENLFPVPFVARYIRIHPFTFMQRPALRMELLGCDLNSCAFPLGLQKKLPNKAFTASTTYSFMLREWSASLARLHQEGGANAWRPKTNNPHEWLQVNLGAVKRITGVVTQGARSLLTQMMVTEFSVTVSQDKHTWSSVLEENSNREKIFIGNSDPEEEVLNVFDPPLFGRYLRIHPRGWINDIALRMEVLGCDTQQWP